MTAGTGAKRLCITGRRREFNRPNNLIIGGWKRSINWPASVPHSISKAKNSFPDKMKPVPCRIFVCSSGRNLSKKKLAQNQRVSSYATAGDNYDLVWHARINTSAAMCQRRKWKNKHRRAGTSAARRESHAYEWEKRRGISKTPAANRRCASVLWRGAALNHLSSSTFA